MPDELKAATEKMERQAFEAWISAPPFELSVRRYSNDQQVAAWPGNYRVYNVQLAWCAWEKRAGAPKPPVATKPDPARAAFDAWFAAATFESMGKDWQWSAWQAGAAWRR